MELFSHQKSGIEFASKHKNVIIADEMGLGKTAQAIIACNKTMKNQILVICKNSAKKKWAKEIDTWYPRWENAPNVHLATPYILNGSNKQKDSMIIECLEDAHSYAQVAFIITNYQHARESLEIFNQYFDCLIIDEAHKVKNRKSHTFKAIKSFCNPISKIMMLTGSPMANKPEEIWALLNILYPQQFKSYWKFVQRYCYVEDGFFGKKVFGSKNEEELNYILEDIMIRRLKKDCLDLPEEIFEDEYITLKSHQKKIYDNIQKNGLAIINDTDLLVASVIIAQIKRMQQVAISSELIGEKENIESAKFIWLLDFIQEYPNEKIVVFSMFEKAISAFTRILDENRIKYVRYTGKENLDDRDTNEHLFRNSEDYNVFLSTIETGGESIDLYESNKCVFLDKHWNPEINKQAWCRLHRIGQKNNVTIISLIAENTIDEIVEEVLKNKKDLIQTILNWRQNHGRI